jgi:hypothetical protein
MTHVYSRRWLIALFLLSPLLALSGYRSGALDVTRAVTPTVGIVSTAEGTPSTAGVGLGPGSFNLPAPTAGLSNLSSYRATLNLSFDGTRAGQPEQWSRTYVMLASQNPPARQLTIDMMEKTPTQVFMTELNGAHYERRGANTCTASVIKQGGSLADKWELAGFLKGVIGAEEAGSETVNGVASIHYTFDERALGQQGVTESTGELWVASDGGYIVRYRLVTRGDADYFGEGIEGTLTWNYELTNVNQPVSIELPKDCPAGMVDAPMLPNATDVLSVPGVLRYRTVTSLADTAAFYQKQLPALGWQVHTTPIITETRTLLTFTRGDQQMSVVITAGSGSTRVHILLGQVIGPTATSIPTKVPTRTLRPTRTPVPTRTRPPTRTPLPTRTPRP